MSSILVVCTGNVCRSPLAEGALRDALGRRLGHDAPGVSSAGTAGWEGSPATAESVLAAREREIDISGHVARVLTGTMVEEADLVVAMAAEHRRAVTRAVPSAAPRTFTLKELVRLLEAAPPALVHRLDERVAAAHALRLQGNGGASAEVRRRPAGEDVADPLGMPLDTYRAMGDELVAWTDRLATGLFGPVPPRRGSSGHESLGGRAGPVEEVGGRGLKQRGAAER